jgi:hypothetical protein
MKRIALIVVALRSEVVRASTGRERRGSPVKEDGNVAEATEVGCGQAAWVF